MTTSEAPSCFYISGNKLLKGSEGKLRWVCILLTPDRGVQSRSKRPHDTKSLLSVSLSSSSMLLPDLAPVITVRGHVSIAMLPEI